MRGTAGSAAAPAARCKNWRRGSFIFEPSLSGLFLNHLVGGAERPRDFAERVLRNIGSGLPCQSGLMLAVRITLAHFSVSSAMCFPKSSGLRTNGRLAHSVKRVLILESLKPALISQLSLSIMSVGVFFGAPIPCQPLSSKPGTNSLLLGTSGSTSKRVAVVTASGQSLAALICSMQVVAVSNMACA